MGSGFTGGAELIDSAERWSSERESSPVASAIGEAGPRSSGERVNGAVMTDDLGEVSAGAGPASADRANPWRPTPGLAESTTGAAEGRPSPEPPESTSGVPTAARMRQAAT